MQDLITQKIQTLQAEFQKADEELSKLRPRVQYLETMLQRLDGALTALQTLQEDAKQAPVLATPTNTHVTTIAGA